jgi:hypothetical protein
MAATVTQISRYAVGDQMRVVSDVRGDNSYPTGGYPVSLAQLGFISADTLVIDVQKLASGADAAYDYTNSKLKLFSGGATEVAGANDQSAITYRITATGRYAS